MATIVSRTKLGDAPSIQRMRTAVESGDREELAESLLSACNIDEVIELVPVIAMEAFAKAIQGDARPAGEIFKSQQFFGKSGHFLIAGDYTQRRDGGEDTKLSLMVGQRLDYKINGDPRDTIARVFHQEPSHLPTVIPVVVEVALGNVGSEVGEAFATPDGWQGFNEAELGPALNDMNEQERRYSSAGLDCLKCIFEPRSFADLANFLTDRERAWQARAEEYQLHDFGHATGMGLEAKLGRDLLRIPSNRGREEWRADGVAFRLATEISDRPADVVRSNIAVRFGIDAHRCGGEFLDTDVICTQFTFKCLLESGLLRVTHDGLEVADITDEGYLQMVALMTEYATELTREELRLNRDEALANLYATWSRPQVSADTIQLFSLAVRGPASGIFTSLR